MGGGMRSAAKFCKCIKSVRKTLKARKGSTKEQGAIAVCVKSVIQKKKGRTLKKFNCGKKPRLVTQRRKLRGGYDPCEGYGNYDDKLRTEVYRAIRAGKNEDNIISTITNIPDEDINLPTCDGDYTLLDRAALSGMNRVADALIARGADQGAAVAFLTQVAEAPNPAPETPVEQANARAFLVRLRV